MPAGARTSVGCGTGCSPSAGPRPPRRRDGPAVPLAATGPGSRELARALTAAGAGARAYADLAALERAVAGGAPAPLAVLAAVGAAAGDPGQDADGGLAGRVLGLVQRWLGMERLAGSRLVVVTCGAVSARPGEGVPDLAAAPVWGLVRSARAEHPGRVALADLDPAAAPEERGSLLSAAVAVLAAGEPEVAVRDGRVLARRLSRPERTERLERQEGAGRPSPGRGTRMGRCWSPAAPGRWARWRRHLAGTRTGSLLLASRRGPAAPGVAALAAGLAAAGAAVT